MTGKTSTAITSMKDNKISPLIAKKKGRKKTTLFPGTFFD
jgi:hypothetical protein